MVCSKGAPQALFKIILDPDLSEVGKIEVTMTKEDKTETVATLWEAKGVVLLFMNQDIGGNQCGQVVDKIFGAVT